ncbi:MAG TPA: PEP-CTERM sorting domain-containing protein [Tepidisphaeraceae bacterium]|jgi:hypothetical protein|nr:PEP-CTERM sorting domain-containing protein [Tepidisphaeraceae bacterium]
MLRDKLRRIGLIAAPPAAFTLMAASSLMADNYPYYNTFDTSSTVSTVGNYNPPPIITRFDYGTGNPINAGQNATAWSSVDNTAVDGSGGSIMQSLTFSNSPIAQNGAFTLDIENSDANAIVGATDISFYIMLASGSAYSTQVGGPGASSGYFQVAVRGAGYSFTNTGDVFVGTNPGNATDQGGSGWNFGDPTYSGTSDQGTWEYVNIPLTSADNVIRGLTFQDYDDDATGGRKITGTVTWYIDDLSITAAVPEPATLSLLGLAVPALLARRRRKA